MFQTGANKWATYDAWPPKNATPRKLYLHPRGKLAFSAPPETDTPADEYVSDPANPVPYRPRPVRPTYPGPEWPVWMVQDQRFTHGRPDVLTYETPPLKQDVEVTGRIRVSLWVSSKAKDTDFTAKLIDVHPPSDDYPAGYAMNVEDGILRMRFRNGRGSVDCRIRIAGSRRNGSAKPPSSPSA